MYKRIGRLSELNRPAAYVFCGGFETRALRASELIRELKLPVSKILVIGYDGTEHKGNTKRLMEVAEALCLEGQILNVNAHDVRQIRGWLDDVKDQNESVVVDITGMSRILMMSILSETYDRYIDTKIVYTEAEDYYPTHSQFEALTNRQRSLLDDDDSKESAFLRLNNFEKEEIVYSSFCDVEEISGLSGWMLPNYPLMLIAFLTFKRGRLAAILQAYEANVRYLIKGVPVRDDLKWRASAIEIPNFDLIEDATSVIDIDTLSWNATYDFLTNVYEKNNNRYRYNFLLAPLGSKMQTVGCWLFAKERKDVKVVTSTPRKIFHERYSDGFRETFLVDDLPFSRNARSEPE
jgi:hypothetical protein